METFCGSCFFCRHGWVNNCTDPEGGWALGCRIDGGQAEYVRVPYADQGLTKIPHAVTDRQALFVGTSWPPDTGPLRSPRSHRRTRCSSWAPAPPACALSSASCWENPRRVIVCERDPQRLAFVRAHYPQVLALEPEGLPGGGPGPQRPRRGGCGAGCGGQRDTFRLAWECARPNAVVTVVALYDRPQLLPLPDMYGKNLTFKTGGVDGCNCAQTLDLIAAGKLDTTPIITHTYPLKDIDAAYQLFESRREGVIKVAIQP